MKIYLDKTFFLYYIKVCKAPCAANCPPCLRECQTRCVHSQCKKKCGELCTPCKEVCLDI